MNLPELFLLFNLVVLGFVWGLYRSNRVWEKLSDQVDSVLVKLLILSAAFKSRLDKADNELADLRKKLEER